MEKQDKSILKAIINRYFVDGLSGMALGLFSTLIVGLILKQIGNLLNIEMIPAFCSKHEFKTPLTVDL